MRFHRASLRRRLIWQLLVLQAGILLAVASGLIGLVIRFDLGGVFIDPSVTEIAVRAIRREGGQLVIIETPELRALRRASLSLWFIARSDSGETVSDGPIPEAYRSLGEQLGRISFADLRDTAAPFGLSAIVRKTSGPAGTFSVLAGGGNFVSLTSTTLFLSSLLMIPILLLLGLIAVVAVPWIVSRAFSGVTELAKQAERIDIDRRGNRLPDNGIPEEVRPLVHAVNGALQRLDEGYEQHQRFILDAAHELRTPIAILQTRLETMPEGAFRNRLLADAGRIAALAEQLLDLQRLSRVETVFGRIDLVVLCRRVAADIAPLAIAHGYDLSFETDIDSEVVRGDAAALERVIVNLVQNAIEHGNQKGGIVIRTERGGIVEVSDEGPGIPKEERERIFEPFYRMHPRDRGAGLGLNLVREVIKRHGGHVYVVETSSQGACFRLEIPLADR